MTTELLVRDVQSQLRQWSLNTRVYGAVYVGMRTFLIIASAAVAGQDALRTSFPGLCGVGCAPALALAVDDPNGPRYLDETAGQVARLHGGPRRTRQLAAPVGR